MESLRAAIDDDSVRVVLIAGLPDVGKSRLALAATEHRPIDAVFALDPVSVKISDLLALKSQEQPLIVVVEDPDINRIDELATAALGENIKLVLTVQSSGVDTLVHYGRDSRVKLFNVEPLSETESEQLLPRFRRQSRLQRAVLDRGASWGQPGDSSHGVLDWPAASGGRPQFSTAGRRSSRRKSARNCW